MTEKRKQGIGEKSKNAFASCFIAVLIAVSIPVGMLLLCIAMLIMNMNTSAEVAKAEIQSSVRATCNLPDYQVIEDFYDWRSVNYYHEMDSGNLVIYCSSFTGEWQCTCPEKD